MHRPLLQLRRTFYLNFPIQMSRRPTNFQLITHLGNYSPQLPHISNADLYEMKQFDRVFADTVKCLTNDFIAPVGDMKSVLLRLREVLDYNVPDGKKSRGLFLVKAYKELCNKEIDKNDLYLARMLGWCIEIFQAVTLVLDDIIDQSTTRRGRPCWYKKEDVGLAAINDAFLVENSAYLLLKKYFRHKPNYINIVELFHQVSYKTAVGQSLELTTSSTSGKLDFTKFTLDRYNAIVQYKTSYYSFFLPIASALYLAGTSDQKIHETAKEVLFEIGNLFQVQDDYIDCFGNPIITGKIGSDIEEGKCTWLVVVALRLANPEEVPIIYENYGQKKPYCVAKVKSLYKKLQLPVVFMNYEEKQYKKITAMIDQLEPNVPANIFRQLINTIYKRRQ